MRRSALIKLLFAVAVVIPLAFEIAYRSEITPAMHGGVFKGIARDGWIVDGSAMLFPELASRGNRLVLRFDPWRPGGAPPAHLKVSVCGQQVAEFLATKDGIPPFAINGSCQPREVRFEVVNPVDVPNDTRRVGAKLLAASVTSKFGIPILSPVLYLLATAAVFLLVIFYYLVLPSSWKGASYLLLFAAASLIGWNGFRKWEQLFQLWLLFSSVGLGALLASRMAPIISKRERGEKIYLAAVVLLTIAAGVIRFYGIDFGLPGQYHSDEPRKVGVISRMLEKGSFDPNYFLHPSLLLYGAMFINKILSLIGVEYPPGHQLFVAGRMVSAVAGTFSIPLLYLFGTRMFGAAIGLIGAAGLAFFPLHVTCSRYMKEDCLMVFFLLASLCALVKAAQDNRKGFLYLSGFLAGVCSSSKYSGLLAVLPVVSAPWLRTRSWIPERTWIAPTLFSLLLVPLGFLICTPYSVLNSTTFLADFGSEGNHMLVGHTVAVTPWDWLWMFHFGESLFPGMTVVPVILGLLGVGILLWRQRIEDLMIVALVLTFYLPAEFVKAKPAPQPERYILPVLPFLALAGGQALMLFGRLRRGLPVMMFLTVLFISLPLYRTVELAEELKVDTRIQMAEWMKNNIPAGSKVLINGWGYAPQFFNNEFDVTHLSRTRPMDFELGNLLQSGSEYLIVTSLVYDRFFEQPGQPFLRDRFNEIFKRLPLVKEFRPENGTYGFHNPELRLYSLKRPEVEAFERARLGVERQGVKK